MVQDDPGAPPIEGGRDGLARVRSVRWGENEGGGGNWPDNMPWEDFAGAIRSGPEIAFTKPVRAETVHPASVFLTALLWERQADYLLSRRIPARIEAIDSSDGYATRFRLCINPGWIRNEIESRSELKSGGRVELTIRGQMIRDRYDRLLDALPLGYAPQTPPHSRPGGDFVTLLRFAAAETPAELPPLEAELEASPNEPEPGADDY